MQGRGQPDLAAPPGSEAPGVWRGRWGIVAGGAALGALAALLVNSALLTASAVGGYSFSGWLAEKAHGSLQLPARRLAAVRFGEPGQDADEVWRNLRDDLKAFLTVLTVGALGAALGGAAGVVGALAGRRGPAAGPALPLRWPLGLALIGLVFHGYLLGFAAVVLAGWARPTTRRGRWGRRLVIALAALVVVLWAAALEMDFSPGWSKRYPHWMVRLLYFFRQTGNAPAE